MGRCWPKSAQTCSWHPCEIHTLVVLRGLCGRFGPNWPDMDSFASGPNIMGEWIRNSTRIKGEWVARPLSLSPLSISPLPPCPRAGRGRARSFDFACALPAGIRSCRTARHERRQRVQWTRCAGRCRSPLCRPPPVLFGVCVCRATWLRCPEPLRASPGYPRPRHGGHLSERVPPGPRLVAALLPQNMFAALLQLEVYRAARLIAQCCGLIAAIRCVSQLPHACPSGRTRSGSFIAGEICRPCSGGRGKRNDVRERRHGSSRSGAWICVTWGARPRVLETESRGRAAEVPQSSSAHGKSVAHRTRTPPGKRGETSATARPRRAPSAKTHGGHRALQGRGGSLSACGAGSKALRTCRPLPRAPIGCPRPRPRPVLCNAVRCECHGSGGSGR